MKNQHFILLLVLMSKLAYAQPDSVTNDIRTTRVLRAGIYITYNQFRNNTPAITSGFKIRIDSGKFVRYLLIDEKGKRIRNAYGLCDGERVFINAKVYGQPNYYVPLLLLGDLIYFEDQIAKTQALVSNASGFLAFGLVGGVSIYLLTRSAGMGNPGWVVFLGDDDGNAYSLSRQTITSVLKEYDPELLSKFKSDKNNDSHEVLIRYLQEFNKRKRL